MLSCRQPKTFLESSFIHPFLLATANLKLPTAHMLNYAKLMDDCSQKPALLWYQAPSLPTSTTTPHLFIFLTSKLSQVAHSLLDLSYLAIFLVNTYQSLARVLFDYLYPLLLNLFLNASFLTFTAAQWLACTVVHLFNHHVSSLSC